MILVLQVAAGVFLANLAAAIVSTTLHRFSARRAKADAIEALEMFKEFQAAQSEVPPAKKKIDGGQYL